MILLQAPEGRLVALSDRQYVEKKVKVNKMDVVAATMVDAVETERVLNQAYCLRLLIGIGGSFLGF